jgi:hypothetical protein
LFHTKFCWLAKPSGIVFRFSTLLFEFFILFWAEWRICGISELLRALAEAEGVKNLCPPQKCGVSETALPLGCTAQRTEGNEIASRSCCFSVCEKSLLRQQPSETHRTHSGICINPQFLIILGYKNVSRKVVLLEFNCALQFYLGSRVFDLV